MYVAKCASQTVLTVRHANIIVKELRSGKEATMEVGVSDIPFNTDD